MSRVVTLSKEELIEQLKMVKHPEGGYFVETYRSAEIIEPNDGRGGRPASTGIYFLIGKNDRSHLHRIKSDEMWHYYLGGSLTIFEMNGSTKSFKRTVLGPDVIRGEVLQYVVPANTWFGSYLTAPEEHEWSLVGCTVSPGFDFADFELGSREYLVAEFPAAMDPINLLTRAHTNLNEQFETENSESASPMVPGDEKKPIGL
jgi:uncharacterized protein